MWLQNEASSPSLAVIHDRPMGAAVEEVRKHLRQARAAQDIGHTAKALIEAIDALENVMAEREPSRTIVVRLAAEILKIVECRAPQVRATRDKIMRHMWIDVAHDLLETRLVDQARLHALMGRINDQTVRVQTGTENRQHISLDDLLEY